MQKNLAQKAAAAILSLLSISAIQGQNTSFNLDVLSLWHPQTGPYIDLLCYVESVPGTQTEVAAWLQRGDRVVAADKITLTAPAVDGSSEGATKSQTYQSMIRLAADTPVPTLCGGGP